MRLRRLRYVATAGLLAAALAACGSSGDQPVQGTFSSYGSTSNNAGTQAPPPVSAPTVQIDPKPGWQQAIDSMQPNGPAVTASGLSIQVFGTCASNNNQGMLLKVSGYPPNGSYAGQVLRSDHSVYTYFKGNSRFDRNGQASMWSWNCYTSQDPGGHDKPDTYTLQFTNTTPGSLTNNVTLEDQFTVSY